MSNIKAHFTSRWEEEGVLLEADWSQLEVVVFAFLTQDIQLLKDIREGVDIHKIMYSKCYDIPVEEVTSEQRKGIKACTFHVVYGGGPKSMATRMSLSEDFCQQFIQSFYDRYPMSKLWQDNLVRQVEGTKKLLPGQLTKKGNPVHKGYLKSITGRKYFFRTTDSPDFMYNKGIFTSFNPPEIKNYPVQGLATADIHLMAIGNLFRKAIHNRDKFLIINTVHDSVMCDVKLDFLEESVILIKQSMEEVVDILKNRFNIKWNVKLKVEIKVGSSWANMEKYNVILKTKSLSETVL